MANDPHSPHTQQKLAMMEVANGAARAAADQAQIVDIDGTIARMAELGLSADVISLALSSVPERHIRTVLTSRRRVQSPEAAALTEDLRRLTRLAIRKAAAVIEFGPPDHRIQLIRAIVGNSARLLSTEDDSTTQELREEMDAMYAEMRVPATEHVITDEYSTTEPETADNAATATPAPSPYDQDGEHGVPQTRLELR